MASNEFGVDIQMNDNEVLDLKNPTTPKSAVNKQTMDDNDQNSTNSYGVASGVNNYAVSFTPALTSYVAGQFLKVRFTNGNSGASTININGLGNVPLVKFGGTPLVGGEIFNGSILTIAYDGTNFQLFSGIIGPTGSGSNIIILDDGTPVPNTPHSQLDYVGPGVFATDFGGGRASIFVPGHDRQEVRSSATYTTSSSVYADLTSMSLTTKDLAQKGTKTLGNYLVIFNAQISCSNNSSSGFFILNIAGVDITPTEISDQPGNTGKHNVTLVALVNNLAVGTIIKVRTRIQPGGGGTPTLSIYERSLTFDGINVNTIV